MKKVLSLLLTAVMLLSLCGIIASALSFTDLSESHWAYANVQTLVADGTVSGYEDGSFRPNGTVTRAEFVKMLGKSATAPAKVYNDVAPDHWAYDYITYADFPEVMYDEFKPNTPITRGLVAELLWNRGGRMTNVFAPSIISEQYPDNPAAAAWIYTTGLIQGDGDGINLRLDDTLSRAEAATLIVRARSASAATQSFENIVSPEILKTIYNGLNLFDGKAYDANANITNGELARAALRIGAEETVLTYPGLNTATDLDHPYAKDIAAVCNACFGAENITKDYADATATYGDAVIILTYNFIAKSHTPVIYGDTTSSLSGKYNLMENACLTFAKQNGIISLREDLDKPATLRDITALCLLLDYKIGAETDHNTDTGLLQGEKNHSLLLIPEGYGDFRVMLSDMPMELYTTPFVSQTKTPAETYNFAREYHSLFVGLINSFKNDIKKTIGYDVRLTYFPSLVCENGNGYTMRIACEVLSGNGSKSISDLFPVNGNVTGAGTLLAQGATVYLDIATGGPFASLAANMEKAYVEQIVLTK